MSLVWILRGRWASMLTPDGPFNDNVRQSLCHFIHVFVSPAAAETWTTAPLGTYQVTVGDAFEIARRQNAGVYPTLVGATA